jgi:hypothetical protein
MNREATNSEIGVGIASRALTSGADAGSMVRDLDYATWHARLRSANTPLDRQVGGLRSLPAGAQEPYRTAA